MDIFLLIATSLLTVFVCVLLFNLTSPGKRIEHKILPKGPLNSPEVIRSIGQLLGPPLTAGNKISTFHNGDQIFPQMLSAIENAESTITFETFIYWSGEIGEKIANALIARAQAGVKVHVLLDWFGSQRFENKRFEDMRQAGIQVEPYRPLHWYNLTRANNRTHRKILVIDGKIGFTGGVGIADQWLGNAQDQDHWRDTHFQVEGPVVAQLQSAFLDNWNATRPEVLHGNEYFPELKPMGQSLAQVFKSSPEEGSGSVRLMYLYSIAHAEKRICIANAYFVPDSHVIQLLVEARSRGVIIEVVLPGAKIDAFITRHASRGGWGDLLKAGIKIFEYQETMFHCKYMIVDGLWVSVGSTNLDNRSLRLNDECNLNVVDQNWASEMMQVFEKDKLRSKEITLEIWNQRSVGAKLIDFMARRFRTQL